MSVPFLSIHIHTLEFNGTIFTFWNSVTVLKLASAISIIKKYICHLLKNDISYYKNMRNSNAD